jgi:hypothetical protein
MVRPGDPALPGRLVRAHNQSPERQSAVSGKKDPGQNVKDEADREGIIGPGPGITDIEDEKNNDEVDDIIEHQGA